MERLIPTRLESSPALKNRAFCLRIFPPFGASPRPQARRAPKNFHPFLPLFSYFFTLFLPSSPLFPSYTLYFHALLPYLAGSLGWLTSPTHDQTFSFFLSFPFFLFLFLSSPFPPLSCLVLVRSYSWWCHGGACLPACCLPAWGGLGWLGAWLGG